MATQAGVHRPLSDAFCYKCHKSDNTSYAGNPNTGKDWFNGQNMTTKAQTVGNDQFATQIFAIIGGATTVRSYNISSDTWTTLTGTPATAPGAGPNFTFHGGNFAYFPGAGGTAFQMMDPFGTPDANSTPATPRWAAPAPRAQTPVLPRCCQHRARHSPPTAWTSTTYRATLLSRPIDWTRRWLQATFPARRGWIRRPAHRRAWPTYPRLWATEAASSGAVLTTSTPPSAGHDHRSTSTGSAPTHGMTPTLRTFRWRPLRVRTCAGQVSNYVFAIRGSGTSNFYRGKVDATTARSARGRSMTSPTANFGAGAELTWDGGKYLYAFQGGGTGFWRYDIYHHTWSHMA